MISYFNKI